MRKILGIDIGSSTSSLVLVGPGGQLFFRSYLFHAGQIRATLARQMEMIDLSTVDGVAYTSSCPGIFRAGMQADNRVASITAAQHFFPGLEALLVIGAEKFGMASFDAQGNYLNYRSNTSCAAGTGSFLDQQLSRLNIGSIRKLGEMAVASQGDFPHIASRCSVFAKTDLIHAQQEGYSLPEICDGLCYGLAKNVVDAVFEEEMPGQIVLAGGVSLNAGVVKHIRSITGAAIKIGEHSHLYGAIGAAMMAYRDPGSASARVQLRVTADLLQDDQKKKKYYNPPLSLQLSDYPDFSGLEEYAFRSVRQEGMGHIDVTLYEELPGDALSEIWLGIDIGSTSTKAVLTDAGRRVLAGLYTRTSGRPVSAVQLLFEAIENISTRYNHRFVFRGAGTTGSGRKLIGKIIGADEVPDEITAHARAAIALDPGVDTIIEIGGQDSKFTLLQDGIVTFSIMNNVCAAGTGSFIEEQAQKLNCPLSAYAERASRVGSPMTSDRCTVFMERDLNHYLNEGYSTDELLASVLHSIRDNYLAKVTGKARVGERIFFQGATAKNRALVAAFEQKLQKPVMVSKFCHLTGALGVALILQDRGQARTLFRGTSIWKNNIAVHSEMCTLCNNNCKLRVADVEGEKVAYGFLCGRDYGTEKYVSHGHDAIGLLKEYRKVFRFYPETKDSPVVVGLPSALYMSEELFLWQKFFDLLGISTITSDRYGTAVKDGKKIAEAEFCAPVAAAFGHVKALSQQADFVFLPVYLENGKHISKSKQYCYYTQFISSMISSTAAFRENRKLLMPLVRSLKSNSRAISELTEMLQRIGFGNLGSREVGQAFREAHHAFEEKKLQWKKVFSSHHDPSRPEIVLLGRPYTVLTETMNNRIPELFASKGYNAYYMDMLPEEPNSSADHLVRAMVWRYASSIIQATGRIARSENLYPVLITSFKCTPDSFVIEYFREIMESFHKPYLVLQLDEHDSAVGYETRIEAALRSFMNHFERSNTQVEGMAENSSFEDGTIDGVDGSIDEEIKDLPGEVTEILRAHHIDPGSLEKNSLEDLYDLSTLKTGETSKFSGKTVLLPGWDLYATGLLEAVLNAEGWHAALIADTPDTIQRSLNTNTGQCLPLNIVVQNAYEYIVSHELDPAQVVIWVPKGVVACNLTMFPHYMRKLLRRFDESFGEVSVYPGNMAFYDFSVKMGVNAFLAFMFAGSIRKVGCRIRPYEMEKGATDRVINRSQELLYAAFRDQRPKEPVLKEIMAMFDAIETKRESRPKVAIFGDIYVRDNDVFNQDLVKVIEANGGEALVTSMSEYLKIILKQLEIRMFQEGRYLEHYNLRLLKHLIPLLDKKYNRYFSKYTRDIQPLNGELKEILDKYHLQVLHRGESVENILKIENLVRNYDDISLFVQTNPAYCCPSLVTEAMASGIERATGIPVLSIEYDGTKASKNEGVIPYLKLRSRVQS